MKDRICFSCKTPITAEDLKSEGITVFKSKEIGPSLPVERGKEAHVRCSGVDNIEFTKR